MRLCLVRWQSERLFPAFRCLGIFATDAHFTSDFCECPTTIYVQRRYRFNVRNFSDVPGKPAGLAEARRHLEIAGPSECQATASVSVMTDRSANGDAPQRREDICCVTGWVHAEASVSVVI